MGVPDKAYSALLTTAVDAVILIDGNGVIRDVNPAAEGLFGYAEGELAGRPVHVLMPEPHRSHHGSYVQQYAEGKPRRMVGQVTEVQGLRKDGTPLDLLISVSSMTVEGETFFAGIARDLTGRKRLEAELARANTDLESRVRALTRRLEQANNHLESEIEQHRHTADRLDLVNKVVERAHHGVVITDRDNRIIYVNPAYEQLTGFKRREAIGSKPSISKSGRHGDAFYQAMWASLAECGHWEGEIWDRREDGTVYPKYLSIDRISDEAGRPLNYVAMFHDLSEKKATEQELERLHHYDPLTNLPNRVLFRNRLQHEFEVSKRHETCAGLLVMNLDRFKHINDTFGFGAGDALLIEVAERLSGVVRGTDTVARQENRRERDPDLVSRVGADDFALILSDLQQPEDAALVARRLNRALDKPFSVNGEEVYLRTSSGIAVFPDNASTPDALIHCAETALRRAKEIGSGEYRFFSEEMNENSANRVRLEAEMRRAISEESFVLYYQPKMTLADRRMVGGEALIRWPKADGGMISPGDFIPLAEESSLIVPLGEWILRRACLDTASLPGGPDGPSVAVNLSARQFQQPDLLRMVEGVLKETGIDPGRVELEITESMVMDNTEHAIATMRALRDLGVHLAIDDFGTGYSSLSYLKTFPVNTLKIDRGFVRDLVAQSQDAAIVQSVVTLGRSLGLNVVAEGVETAEQLEFLSDMGCAMIQGFHIARPMPFRDYAGVVEA